MASTSWRAFGFNTLGQNLALFDMLPWDVAGAVLPSSIQASVQPIVGNVADWVAGSASEVVFSSDAVKQPGFYIEFSFASAVELRDFRFRGPDATRWPKAYMLSAAGVDSLAKGGPRWSDGELSPAGIQPAAVDQFDDTLKHLTAGPAGMHYGVGVSAAAGVIASAPYGLAPFISRDFGATWSRPAGVPGLQYARAATSDDGAVILFSNWGGPLYLSTDAGVSFSAVGGAGSHGWEDCAVSGDGNTMFATDGGASGGLWRSTDRGVSWTICAAAGLRNWQGVALDGAGDLVLATAAASKPLLSTDGGASWAEVAGVPPAADSRSAVSRTGTALVVSSRGGTIHVSWDAGSTWERDVRAPGHQWRQVSFDGGGTFFVAVPGASAGVVYCRHRDNTTKQFAFPSATLEAVGVDNYGIAWIGSADSGTLGYVRPWMQEATHHPVPMAFGSLPSPQVILSGVNPLPQGLQGTDLQQQQKVLDAEFGGQGRIYGTVARKGTSANVPLKRRVRLHRSRDGYLVRETWSRADGSYEFTEISTRYEYDVIAWDHLMQDFSTVANNQLAEVTP